LVAPLTNFAPRQFLQRIVTADEIWVHHYEPESKAQSMTWKRLTSTVAKKFKSQPSAGKIMLTLFGIGKVQFWLISLQRVKPSTVRFPYVWPNERSSKRKKIFIRRRSHWGGAELVKDERKKFSSPTELKKTCETLEPVP
jgi:hypothetical protein